MNKYTERLKIILTFSSILKVLAPLASYIKRANNQNQFKQNLPFRRVKEHVQRCNFSLLQTFHSRKCNSIFATSVIKVGVSLPLREKCPNTVFFLFRISLYSVQIQENTDQKKPRIWTLFMQCAKFVQSLLQFFVSIQENTFKRTASPFQSNMWVC